MLTLIVFLLTIVSNTSKELGFDNDTGFVGRWYLMTVNKKTCYVTNNCGSSIFFATEGASKILIEWEPMTNTNAYYSITIDNNPSKRLSIAESTVLLPDSKKHSICITTDGITENIGKWEKGKGFALSRVAVNKGKIVRCAHPTPVIAFYGDSITEGIRSLGISEDMGDTNSATSSFPWFCCKEIDAVPFFIGYGASGVLSDGSFHRAIDTLNYYYKDYSARTESIDAIVINYGTNDKGYDSIDFINAYNEFLNELKKKYPNTPIYIMIPFDLSKQAEIRAIAKQNSFATLVDTSTWEGITYTDGIHPDTNGARIIGEHLSSIIDR